MIQANELRIGNIVTVDNPAYYPELTGKLFKVLDISRAHKVSNRWTHSVGLFEIDNTPIHPVWKTYSQYIEFIAPIPLTEELLLKCGLKEEEYGERITCKKYHLMPITIYRINNGFEAEISTYDDCINIAKNSPQYLHQLQNLYHALTGKELEITL